VRHDVRRGIETVRRDLTEFNDEVRDDVVFVGGEVMESVDRGGGGGGRDGSGRGDGSDSDGDSGSEYGDDAFEAFEAADAVLEDVGAKVERFGNR
jgi:hypothetical protein